MDSNKPPVQEEEEPPCSNPISWTDTFFLGSSVVCFSTAIIACFVPQLLVTRPFFFGMLASLLTHKFLGGVGEGEITDFKSAIGSIKVSGPIAVLFFSMIAIQGIFYASERWRIIAKIDPSDPDSLTVFKSEEAEGTQVVVRINDDPTKLLTIKSTKDSLFSYFIEKCYLDKSSGCKKEVRFVAKDSLRPGNAVICKGSIDGVRITISGKDAEQNELDSPLAVSLSADSSCRFKKNIIYISSGDAQKSNIKLNKKNEGQGYISPFLGQITPDQSQIENRSR